MIYSTKSYRHSLGNLTTKKKNKFYGCIKLSVEEFLRDNSFSEIWEMNYHLRNIHQLKLSKIRIANKTMKKGKSGGFRLILLLDSRTENIYLLTVYPKIGPDKKGNISDQEEEKLIKSFSTEFKENSLELIVISDP